MSFTSSGLIQWYNIQCTSFIYIFFFRQRNMNSRQTPSSQRSILVRLWTTSTLTPWGMGHSTSVTWSQVKLIQYFKCKKKKKQQNTVYELTADRILVFLSFQINTGRKAAVHFFLHWQWGRHLGLCTQLWIHHRIGCTAGSLSRLCWACKQMLVQIRNWETTFPFLTEQRLQVMWWKKAYGWSLFVFLWPVIRKKKKKNSIAKSSQLLNMEVGVVFSTLEQWPFF